MSIQVKGPLKLVPSGWIWNISPSPEFFMSFVVRFTWNNHHPSLEVCLKVATKCTQTKRNKKDVSYWLIILIISILHYSTPPLYFRLRSLFSAHVQDSLTPAPYEAFQGGAKVPSHSGCFRAWRQLYEAADMGLWILNFTSGIQRKTFMHLCHVCVCVSKSLIYNHGRCESSTKLQLSMLRHVPPEKSKIHRNISKYQTWKPLDGLHKTWPCDHGDSFCTKNVPTWHHCLLKYRSLIGSEVQMRVRNSKRSNHMICQHCFGIPQDSTMV